ncbi:MAG: sigma-70 family RNA polymerase sigma factor [Phycisphaerae bacterium]|jgi:RNA polymerase sigma factor (sigma-70 family)
MQKIKNVILAQLLMETRFGPKAEQLKQLESAEELYKIISPSQDYPFEFVCFRITGYRPKEQSRTQMIPGKELLESLPGYIAKASARLHLKAEQQDEKIYSLDELAKKFNISIRTLERWQKRGLLGRKYIFPEGSLKTGFTESAINEFAKANQELIQNASKFSTIEPHLKNEIAKRAGQLAQDQSLSRTAVIKKVAAEFGRAAETIRLILIEREKNQKKPVFQNRHAPIGTAQAVTIFNMYQDGATVQDIAEKFGRSTSSIYRIITQKRIKKLLAVKIEYIPSDEFLRPDAQKQILLDQPYIRRTPRRIISEPDGRINQKDWQQFIETVKKIPMLNREQEVQLFRRYNFLKYLSADTISKLSLHSPCGRTAYQAQELLNEAGQLKNIIIEANLKLVVKIAGRHSTGANLQDLVSEGNMALMRAVEKFDYMKGFRFSTYASWVISRAFARYLPAQARMSAGAEQSADESQQAAAQTSGIEDIETAHSSLMQVIDENLTERERYVIRYHFGLSGTIVKKDFKTLKQIGEDLGVTKERVRQIELESLQKLRQTLSPEEFELLTR